MFLAYRNGNPTIAKATPICCLNMNRTLHLQACVPKTSILFKRRFKSVGTEFFKENSYGLTLQSSTL